MTRAELLELLASDLRNERKHLNFYLYHASAVIGLHGQREYREWLLEAAASELAHVTAFQDRLWGLGAAAVDTSASDFECFTRVEDVLDYAREMEEEVVANYTQRLAQLEGANFLESRYMAVFYEDQLQDSYEDCERIRRILADSRATKTPRLRPL
jgi:rubrerythrin